MFAGVAAEQARAHRPILLSPPAVVPGVAQVHRDDRQRLAAAQRVVHKLEDHQHVHAHEVRGGVRLRGELVAGHHAAQEVKRVPEQPLRQEPGAEALRGAAPEVLRELRELRHEPARDAQHPEREADRVRAVVHAVSEPDADPLRGVLARARAAPRGRGHPSGRPEIRATYAPRSGESGGGRDEGVGQTCIVHFFQ